MNADMIFTRINQLDRRNACCVFSNVFGIMKNQMTESDLNLMLSSLEYYEEREEKEDEREAVFFGRT